MGVFISYKHEGHCNCSPRRCRRPGRELPVYRSGLEAIFNKVPKPESLLTPDGVCSDGEGWGCIGEIATTVMDCIAEIGMDPQGVQKCVADAIGTASDCYDCICWVMESVGLGCPSV